MDVIICGGGSIGGSAAQVLANAGDAVTVIESDDQQADDLAEHLDVAIVHGVASASHVLRQAGVATADAVIATTASDEVNLVCCALARALGASRTMARVDHSGLLRDSDLDYASLFGVSRLFSPDRALARTMAARLRNPEASAIEQFGGGIEMQQFAVDPASDACGERLRDVQMPAGTRLAAVCRDGHTQLPTAQTRLCAGDEVLLVAQQDAMDAAHALLGSPSLGRRQIAIYGSAPSAMWLCRALGPAAFDIRVFEPDHDRATWVSEQLDFVTVLCADPAKPEVFDDEHLEQVDAFISTCSDEQNLLACGHAARMGVHHVLPVLHRNEFAPLLEKLGITETFNPQTAAVREIRRFLHATTFELLQFGGGDGLLLMRAPLGDNATMCGVPLRDVHMHPPVVIVAAERSDGTAFVPGPDSVLVPGRRVLAISTTDTKDHLRQLFDIRATS